MANCLNYYLTSNGFVKISAHSDCCISVTLLDLEPACSIFIKLGSSDSKQLTQASTVLSGKFLT